MATPARLGTYLRRWALALLAGAFASLAHAADDPNGPERFFHTEHMTGAALSPDGQTLAMTMIAPDTGRIRLVAMNLATKKLTLLAAYDDTDVRTFHWINDHRLVFDLVDLQEPVGEHRFAFGLYAVNSDGSVLRQLVNRQWDSWIRNGEDQQVLPWWTHYLRPVGDGSDDVYIETAQEGDGKSYDYVKLERLETIRGKVKSIDTPVHSFEWVFDSRGVLRVATVLKDNHRILMARDPATDTWSELGDFARFYDGKAFHPQFIDADGTLYVTAANGGDTQAVWTYDLGRHKMADKPFLVSPRYDLDPRYLVSHGKLAGLRYVVDAPVTQWVSPDLQALQAKIDQLLPSTSNEVSMAANGDGRYAVIHAFSDHLPGLYFLYGVADGKLLTLGNARPDIDPKKMADMEFVHYAARDGLDIPAYLSVPRGAERKNLPLVLLVHGGPYERGRVWGWDPEVQFLAAHGYAVLEPAFRGTTGYGNKLFSAAIRQWGLAMQDDLADGVKWAVAQGLVDPKRVCIMGASYGGYAVLMGLAKDPDLYRCGVEWVGVSDIDLLFSSRWSDASDTWKKYGASKLIGDPKADAAQFKATSPVENAAKIRAPLLMAYGKEDRRVPLEHGERMHEALEKQSSAKVEWIVYDKEGHGWHYYDDTIDFWNRVAKFLDANLGTR